MREGRRENITIFFVLIAVLLYSCENVGQEVVGIDHIKITKLDSISAEAIEFARQRAMDTTMCILVDMSIHSGKNRLFVYDFTEGKVIYAALCAHGSCDGSYANGTVHFSNIPESHCSSKGKYKIGARGWSNWGEHFNYKLHGLDKTNNNAYKRIIVLHSYEYVEDEEIYPDYVVNSWGCPMVSNATLRRLDAYIKAAKKPVLLWMYD